jgi:hypothetical protein
MSTALSMENVNSLGNDSLSTTSYIDDLNLKSSNSVKPLTGGQVVAISLGVSVGVVVITIGGYTLYKYIKKKKDEKEEARLEEAKKKILEENANNIANVIPQPVPAPQVTPAPVAPNPVVVNNTVAQPTAPQAAPQVSPTPAPVAQPVAPQPAPQVIKQEMSLQDVVDQLTTGNSNGQLSPEVLEVFNSLSEEEKQQAIAAANSAMAQKAAMDAQAAQAQMQQPVYNPAFAPQNN